MTHKLKTDPDMFAAVREGRKTFEIRKDDRGFKEGDFLILEETRYNGAEIEEDSPLEFTGNTWSLEIGYILKGPIYGLKNGWVIMSIL